ncbi:Uncharacterised protein [Nocardia cyriacigeorgica]|uniref:Uncharacterized protein n=1 Tax=Nocardia cyriacigeorgica TaxID=135487 RepID=A0A4U8W683_9NOCA|nr:Uncharacterised protein [Nocardia cyriacigeorgica]
MPVRETAGPMAPALIRRSSLSRCRPIGGRRSGGAARESWDHPEPASLQRDEAAVSMRTSTCSVPSIANRPATERI